MTAQTFQLMPSSATGTPDATAPIGRCRTATRTRSPRPYYYGVTFDNGIKTEIAPTDHAAVLQFTFTGDSGNLIFDNVATRAALTIDAATQSFSGYSDVRAGPGRRHPDVRLRHARPPGHRERHAAGGGGTDVTGYVKVDPGAAKTLTCGSRRR